MRVPPEIINPKPRWQLPAVLIVLALTVLVTGVLTGSENRAIATQSNRITKLEVVIARKAIPSGSPLTLADLTLAVRPIESLPEGVLTRLEEAVGRTAAVDMKSGMPLAASLIAGAEVAAPPEDLGAPPEIAEDIPVRKPTVAVHVPEPVVPMPEPIVEAKIAKKVEAKLEPKAEAAPPKQVRRKLTSYAWVAGERMTFGVSKSGKVQIVNENGDTTPLDDYRGDE